MNRRGRRGSLLRLAVFAVVLAAVGSGAYFYGLSQSPAGLSGEAEQSVRAYADALEAVRENYVDQEAVDTEDLTYSAIEGMMESLGDQGHTRFLTPQEREQNQEQLSGEYTGVGVRIQNEGDKAVVVTPIEGSPAAEAGIESGDVIVAVDGENVRGDSLSEISEQVSGPAGSQVELTVVRDGEEQQFTLERAEVETSAVSWTMVPSTDTAHIRLRSFSNDSAEEVRRALEAAKEAGAEAYVLDLRNNAGGRVREALQIAGMFLEPDSVVYLRQDASGEREKIRVPDDAERIVEDTPVKVLVNGGTASSSEIVAGALRDNGRAELIGTSTFGTGTVLQEYDLSGGSSILLGIAEWLTPSGDFIRKSGIEPGIKVELSEDEEPLSPRQVESLTRDEISSRDPQLSRAIEKLTER